MGRSLIIRSIILVVHEERLLRDAFRRYGIRAADRRSITRYLEVLKTRSEGTYRHSIRVGVLSAKIGDYLGAKGVKAKPLFWAGLLHDVGKALIDHSLLVKKGKFTEDDYKQMESHVEYGFCLLHEIHEWTAQIIVRHHRFGKRPYPARLPSASGSPGMEKIFDMYGRLLALADYYDALMTRDNDKFGKNLSASEKREVYLRDNSDQKALVLELEKAGILSFSA